MKIFNLGLALAIFVLSVMNLFDVNLIEGKLQGILLSVLMGSFFILHASSLEKTTTRRFMTWLGYFVIVTGIVRLVIAMV